MGQEMQSAVRSHNAGTRSRVYALELFASTGVGTASLADAARQREDNKVAVISLEGDVDAWRKAWQRVEGRPAVVLLSLGRGPENVRAVCDAAGDNLALLSTDFGLALNLFGALFQACRADTVLMANVNFETWEPAFATP